MTVREAIEQLQKFDPDAEFHHYVDNSWECSTEVDEFYAGTATYGVLTKTPRTVATVVATHSCAGL